MQTNSSTGASNYAANGTKGNGAPASNTGELSEMFTKLLVAQIQNQDPLAPADSNQFVNQLAQLSQTEALQKLSNLTSNSAIVLQSMQMLAMGAQVGASVMVEADSVTLGQSVVQGTATLQSATADATLVLTGADGARHSIALGARGAGEVPFSIDPEALGLPPGAYSIKVESANGETPAIAIAGKLQRVKLTPEGALLSVEHVGMVMPSMITSFEGHSAATAY